MPENDGVIYGETPEGLVAPRFPVWRAWLVRRAIERFGKNARTESTARLGWIIDRVGWALHIVWEGIAGAYNAAFYQTASGTDIDKQLAVFAFERLDKTQGKGELVLFGDLGTAIPQSSRVATEDTEDIFATNADATIGTLVQVFLILEAGAGEWTLSLLGDDHFYTAAIDDDTEDIARGLATAIGEQATYTATYLGPFPAEGGHMLVIDSSGPDLDGEVVGPGKADVHFAVRAAVTAVDYGPINGFAGTVNDIRNPVTGWVGAINQVDVAIGRNREADATYKARWDRERFGPGKATELAMRFAFAATEELREKVQALRIKDDAPVSFTVTILAPELTNDQIAQIIWDNKALGVATAGPDQGIAKNANKPPEDKVVKFNLATQLYVWIKIVLTKGEGYPLIGDPLTAVAREVAVWGNGGVSPANAAVAYGGLGLGGDFVRFQVAHPINRATPGVVTATIRRAFTASPDDPEPIDGLFSNSDYATAEDEILRFSTSRILVTAP